VICGVGETVIRRPASAVLEFVLDLPRYARADTKIGKIISVNRGRVRHSGRLRGLRGPAVTLTFELDPYSRLVFRSVPKGLGRMVFGFEGSFDCEETPEGTRVVHRECFTFAAPLRWLIEPYVRDWLGRDTQAEVGRMKAILEAGA
jgi:hypothetical protein